MAAPRMSLSVTVVSRPASLPAAAAPAMAGPLAAALGRLSAQQMPRTWPPWGASFHTLWTLLRERLSQRCARGPLGVALAGQLGELAMRVEGGCVVGRRVRRQAQGLQRGEE